MNNEQAVQLLSTVSEEDLFEHGNVFNKMDTEGKVFWRVLEVHLDKDGTRRVTFHLYYRDVFLRALIGYLTPDKKVQWGVQNG